MDDQTILKLFADRDERAIAAAQAQYGRGCYQIALRVLNSREDAEEAVNDMWLRVWNTFPSAQPDNLLAYLSAATRNCALDKLSLRKTAKRGGGERTAALDELAEIVPAKEDLEEVLNAKMLQSTIMQFLDGLSSDARTIFVERYTRLTPISEIAAKFSVSESKVKITLMRVRKKMKTYLKKEGWL